MRSVRCFRGMRTCNLPLASNQDAAVRRPPFAPSPSRFDKNVVWVPGLGGGNVRLRDRGRPNGPEVNPRGQGPRSEAAAARRMPAFEARDAGGVTPLKCR